MRRGGRYNKIILKTKNERRIVIVLCCLVLLASCKKDTKLQSQVNNFNTMVSTNLITNPSFECYSNSSANTTFCLTGYSILPGEILAIDSSYDVPPGGGNYSLKIYCGSTQQGNYFWGRVNYYVTNINGTYNYTLSCWMKGPTFKPNNANGILIGKLINKSVSIIQYIKPDTTIWKRYIITLPITTTSNDTIVIQLNGGTAPVSPISYTLFDLIELQKN